MESQANVSLPEPNDRIGFEVTGTFDNLSITTSPSKFGEQIGERIAEALKPILSKTPEKATVGIEYACQQILSNVRLLFTIRAISDTGNFDANMREAENGPQMFIKVDQNSRGFSAATVYHMFPPRAARYLVNFMRGPYCTTEVEAVMALYEKSKVAVSKGESILYHGGWKDHVELE